MAKDETVSMATPEQLRKDLAEGFALVKMQNEQMMLMARAEPRNDMAILEAACKELDLVPELSAENYYSIPYKDKDKGTVYVQGISIKGALNLARLWGYLDVGSAYVKEDAESAVVEGIVLDFQSIVRFRSQSSVSRISPRRAGPPVRLSEDFWIRAKAAAISKTKRNAILDALPSWFKARYFKRCLEMQAERDKAKASEKGTKPWKEILKRFEEIGVTRKMLEGLLGHTMTKLTDDELGRLRGVYHGIKSGEVPLEEAFPKPRDEKTEGEGETGTVEAALAGGAETTAGTEASEAACVACGKPATVVVEEGQGPSMCAPCAGEAMGEPDPTPPATGPQAESTDAATICPGCNRAWSYIIDGTLKHGKGCPEAG